MPELTTSPSADILALPQEDRMQLAITAIADAGHSADGTSSLHSPTYSWRNPGGILRIPTIPGGILQESSRNDVPAKPTEMGSSWLLPVLVDSW